jgi:hypothetical protein
MKPFKGLSRLISFNPTKQTKWCIYTPRMISNQNIWNTDRCKGPVIYLNHAIPI